MSRFRNRSSQLGLRLLSLGAGVQSTIVRLLACEGQFFVDRSLQPLDQVDLSPPTRRRHLVAVEDEPDPDGSSFWACRSGDPVDTVPPAAGRAAMSLTIVPVTFRQPCAFVAAHHRHHSPPRRMKFALGVAAHGDLVGVATVGRPVARHLDDGYTAEVTRTRIDGTPNTNSMLLGAAWRQASAMGYHMLITYTQVDESGASVRAVGFARVAELPARPGWHTPSRPRRRASRDRVARVRWEIRAGDQVEARPCSGTPAGESITRVDLRAPALAPTTTADLRPRRQRPESGRAGIDIAPTYISCAREAISTITRPNDAANSAIPQLRNNDTSQALRRLNLRNGECGDAA